MRNMLDYFDEDFHKLMYPTSQDSFPPYDAYRYEDGSAKVVVAVAGYTRDDLDITFDGNLLDIRGNKREEPDEEAYACTHRGIARRAFTLRFNVPEPLVVSSAEIQEGLLTVYLVVDEAKAPKQIPIQ